MKDILKAKELEMLKGNVRGTPEGKAQAGMEYKRTKLSIDLLNFVIEGKYAQFISCQNKDNKLSPESFAEIQQFTNSILGNSEEAIYAMQVYLVINDLGKVVYFIERIEKEFGLQSVDHDKLLYEGLKRNPSLSETFCELSTDYQELILEGLKAEFNMGQFVQSENLPANLLPLKNINRRALDFYMVHVLYDIGGAAGHVRNDGSLIITENYWKNFKMAYNSLILMNNGLSANEAYNDYLQARAESLKLPCYTSEDKAIIKICNLLRVTSEKEAFYVQSGFRNQPLPVRSVLTVELGVTDGINRHGFLMYYFPATLANAVNYFKNEGFENPLFEAFNIVLPIIANLYGYAKARVSKDKVSGMCTTVFIGAVAEKAKNPLELPNCIFELNKVNEDYTVICHRRENIKIHPHVSGKNVLAVGMGGGSDCIQATMIGKFLLKNCKNVISIRSEKTGSQDVKGKMNNVRLVYGVEKNISDNVYLCNAQTRGEGRFFEDLPARVGINCYLIIDKNDGKLFSKIQEVLADIEKRTGEKIDAIVGVDTGGDCLYPLNDSVTTSEASPNQDRNGMEAISQFEDLGYQVYSCIVSPGIDTPNGIASDILNEAGAFMYFPTEEEKKQILDTYYSWKMNGKDASRVGKTSLIWQAALEGRRGLISLNLPEYLVMSEENPWIANVTVENISEAVVFMKTSDAIKAIKMYE